MAGVCSVAAATLSPPDETTWQKQSPPSVLPSHWINKKPQEKLNYMFSNPLNDRVAKPPRNRPWSSWRSRRFGMILILGILALLCLISLGGVFPPAKEIAMSKKISALTALPSAESQHLGSVHEKKGEVQFRATRCLAAHTAPAWKHEAVKL
jgi:hypothetical protein